MPINKKNHVNGALQNLQFVLKNDGAAARRKILSFLKANYKSSIASSVNVKLLVKCNFELVQC